MNVRKKFLIFHDLEHRDSGLYVSSPRHISILQPFYITDEYDRLSSIVDQIARRTKPFTISAGEPDMFGHQRDIAVERVVDNEGGLSSLHYRLMLGLGKRGLDYLIDTEWSGIRYNPHSTKVEGVPFPDDPYTVNDISYYVADREDRKHVVRVSFSS